MFLIHLLYLLLLTLATKRPCRSALPPLPPSPSHPTDVPFLEMIDGMRTLINVSGPHQMACHTSGCSTHKSKASAVHGIATWWLCYETRCVAAAGYRRIFPVNPSWLGGRLATRQALGKGNHLWAHLVIWNDRESAGKWFLTIRNWSKTVYCNDTFHFWSQKKKKTEPVLH